CRSAQDVFARRLCYHALIDIYLMDSRASIEKRKNWIEYSDDQRTFSLAANEGFTVLQTCNEIADSGIRDWCLFFYVTRRLDWNDCMDINDIYVRNKCIFSISNEHFFDDPSICLNIQSLEYVHDLYGMDSYRDSCIIKNSINTYDYTNCKSVVDLIRKHECYTKAISSIPGYEHCSRASYIRPNKSFDDCIEFISKIDGHEFCIHFSDNSKRESCYIEFALEKEDVLFCDKKFTKQDYCLDLINDKLIQFLNTSSGPQKIRDIRTRCSELSDRLQKDLCFFIVSKDLDRRMTGTYISELMLDEDKGIDVCDYFISRGPASMSDYIHIFHPDKRLAQAQPYEERIYPYVPSWLFSGRKVGEIGVFTDNFTASTGERNRFRIIIPPDCDIPQNITSPLPDSAIKIAVPFDSKLNICNLTLLWDSEPFHPCCPFFRATTNDGIAHLFRVDYESVANGTMEVRKEIGGVTFIARNDTRVDYDAMTAELWVVPPEGCDLSAAA
ncbi:MAG: hypothetical protein QF415_02605, partial [Candidatus Undinarchaeales archaeon]|nr:hypothetical protein [Candidatus Undinarchaeales archaeon]